MLASRQVIQAIVAQLIAAGTPSASRVYADRFHPSSGADPVTYVIHADEAITAPDDDVTWPMRQQHTLQVDVSIRCTATTDLDAAMAAQALATAQALQATARPLPGLPVDLRVTRISYQPQATDQAAVGVAIVRLEAEFQTASNDLATIL